MVQFKDMQEYPWPIYLLLESYVCVHFRLMENKKPLNEDEYEREGWAEIRW